MLYQQNIKDQLRQKKITIAIIKQYIQSKLNTNDRWMYTALIRLYSKQTLEEQTFDESLEINNQGFSSADAELLSSYAKQYESKKFLTPKQKHWCRTKILKYWEQIWNISDQERMIDLIEKENNDDQMLCV